jgi:hypothetical protein
VAGPELLPPPFEQAVASANASAVMVDHDNDRETEGAVSMATMTTLLGAGHAMIGAPTVGEYR